jgi:DNA modification methylase
MPASSVDLIYLDPPFNSQQNYNLLYTTLTGKPVPEQAEAFCDTWEMDAQKEELARNMPLLMREHGVENYYIEFWRLWIQALRNTQPHLLAYMIYMVQRLLHMKVILRNTGSIYLHCDPTASHYIKVMMDGIFGHKNFRNEIIWRRTGSHGARRTYGPIHDVILFYTKSDKYTFNVQKRPYMRGHVESRYSKDDDGRFKFTSGGNILTGPGATGGESGQIWRGFNPTLKKLHWAIPGFLTEQMPAEFRELGVLAKLDALFEAGLIDVKEGNAWPTPVRFLGKEDGTAIQDIWAAQPYTEGTQHGTNDIIDSDVAWLGTTSPERLGYPTQKPVGLLKRIIATSSNADDVIFDPFCGCGTTVYAAEQLKRDWIGCDVAILSVKMMREVLTTRYKLTEGKDFEVRGIPVSEEQAQELFKRDPFQFEHWFVERVGGFPTKKTGDKGIDGRIYFATHTGLKAMVLSVKGGKLRPTDVRDLRGVMADEPDTELAGFLSLQQPSKAMLEAASLAGQYEYQGVMYNRIQFLTVKEVLEEKREFHTPTKMGSRIVTGQQHFAY